MSDDASSNSPTNPSAKSTATVLDALRIRDFSIYLAAQWFSNLGNWMQRIVIQWLVWKLTGSYAWLGGVALAEAVMIVLVMLLAGPIADKARRKHIGMVSQGLMTVASLVLAWAIHKDMASTHILIVFVLFSGFMEGLWSPARMSIVANLVPRRLLGPAFGLASTSFQVTQFVGPALGGLVLAILGPEYAFVITAVCFGSIIAALQIIKFDRRKPVDKPPVGFLAQIGEGVTFIFREPSLRYLMIVATAFSFFIRPYRDLFAGISETVYGTGPEGLATLASSVGGGALIGALFFTVFGHRFRFTHSFVVAACMGVVFLFGFAFAPSFILACVFACLAGACVTMQGTCGQVLLQAAVDDERRGRVMSLWGAQIRGAPAIGAWGIGMLAPSIGVRWGLVLLCVGFAGVMLVYWRSGRQFWRNGMKEVIAARRAEEV